MCPGVNVPAQDCKTSGVSNRRNGKEEMVKNYYIYSVYEDLKGNPMKSKVNGEGAMIIGAADFEKLAIKLRYYVLDYSKENHPSWIVPDLFCVTRYIKNPRVHRSDIADRIVKMFSVYKPMVKFVPRFDL